MLAWASDINGAVGTPLEVWFVVLVLITWGSSFISFFAAYRTMTGVSPQLYEPDQPHEPCAPEA